MAICRELEGRRKQVECERIARRIEEQIVYCSNSAEGSHTEHLKYWKGHIDEWDAITWYEFYELCNVILKDNIWQKFQMQNFHKFKGGHLDYGSIRKLCNFRVFWCYDFSFQI